MTKSPNNVDKHVGTRLRMRRLMVGMSQEKLGDALGLTFQQVQKYEKGTNRIGASRLQQIAQILTVPPAYFFDELPVSALTPSTTGFAEEAPNLFSDFLSTTEGLLLAKAFMRIKDAKVRRKVIDLVRVLADSASEETEGDEADPDALPKQDE